MVSPGCNQTRLSPRSGPDGYPKSRESELSSRGSPLKSQVIGLLVGNSFGCVPLYLFLPEVTERMRSSKSHSHRLNPTSKFLKIKIQASLVVSMHLRRWQLCTTSNPGSIYFDSVSELPSNASPFTFPYKSDFFPIGIIALSDDED